jgi:hypothetical protein
MNFKLGEFQKAIELRSDKSNAIEKSELNKIIEKAILTYKNTSRRFLI